MTYLRWVKGSKYSDIAEALDDRLSRLHTKFPPRGSIVAKPPSVDAPVIPYVFGVCVGRKKERIATKLASQEEDGPSKEDIKAAITERLEKIGFYKKYSYGSLHEKSFAEIWNDVEARRKVMHQIDNVECFANCTKLCKPHESNKMVWQISNTFNNMNDADKKAYKEDLLKQGENVRNNLDHPDFI